MRFIYVLLLISTFLFASENNDILYEEDDENSVNCLILKDENSIICKYIVKREYEEKSVVFQWTDPNGDTTRQREIVIPAGHGSAYDFRYINGRIKGIWTFKVIDEGREYITNFELK